jgi:hypothetical protein
MVRMGINYPETRSPVLSNRCCTEGLVVPGPSVAGLIEIPFTYKQRWIEGFLPIQICIKVA